MKKINYFVIVLTLLAALAFPVSAAISIPDSTNAYVNDYMNVLSQETINEINLKNDQLEGGAEILVLTTDYINTDTEEFSWRVFNQWEIGDSSRNNGVLIVLVVQEEKFWITTGTGLDDVLSAGTLSDILYDHFEEDFDSKNYDRAVLNTFNEIWEILGNKYGLSSSVQTSESHWMDGASALVTWIIVIFVIVLVLAILAAVLTPRKRTIWFGPTYRRVDRRYYDNRPRRMSWGPVSRPRPEPRPIHVPRPSSSRSSFGRNSFGGGFRSSGMRSGGGGRSRGGGAGRK